MRFQPLQSVNIFALAFLIGFASFSDAQQAEVADPGTAKAEMTKEGTEAQAEAAPAVNKAALDRVTYDIKYLASDELGGRKPGTEGIELAAKYIEEQYKAAGLKKLENGTYRQNLEVRLGMTVDDEATTLKLVGSNAEELTMELELGKDFMPQARRGKVAFDHELVFVGYGINAEELNFNEYRGIDADGKVVVLMRREPQQEDAGSVFDGTEVSDHSYINTKVRAAREAGAIGIIMVNDSLNAPNDEKDTLEAPDRFRGTFPFIQLKRRVFNSLLEKSPLVDSDGKKFTGLEAIEKKIDETLSPVSQPMKGWKVVGSVAAKQNNAKTANIIGVIEGEGPNADETIVIGGHYDHLGMGGGASSRSSKRAIHNGADDNATGTAAVIELARRYGSRDKKPARRLVFVCFTAEEMGLLGAKHYVDEDPLYELDKTATMVNFDMIGWLRDDRVTIFNANSSPTFDSVLDSANEGMGMEVIKSTGFGGSDHLPFHMKRIPVMFIHTGLTDTYHTPEDDFETIDCEGATRVIDYSEKVIDGLLALDAKPAFQSANDARRNRVRLGVSLDDDVEGGVEITRIIEDSLAARYELQVGDVITAIGTEATDKRREVVMEIRKNNGKSVMFKIRRGDQNVEKLIELKN